MLATSSRCWPFIENVAKGKEAGQGDKRSAEAKDEEEEHLYYQYTSIIITIITIIIYYKLQMLTMIHYY